MSASPLRRFLQTLKLKLQGWRKFQLRNAVYLLVLAFIFFELLIVFPKKLETSDELEVSQEELGDSARISDQKMQGVHLVESKSGQRDWELFAMAAEGYQSQGSWLLKSVKVIFYTSESTSFTVTGSEGNIDAATKDMRIRGHVKTVSTNGYIFETESIEYRSLSRSIISPDRVKVQGPEDQLGSGLTLTGAQLFADVEKSQMSIASEVSGEKHLKDGKSFAIRSESVFFSGKSKEAQFKGQVKIKYGEMAMESPLAIFKYSEDNKFLSRLNLQDGVKVTYQDKVAQSQKLDLDLLKNKFVFSGKPKLIQNEDELTGDEIIFLDGGKRVKVEKVKATVEGR